MATRHRPKTIQSVERACEILFSFSPERPRWRVSELSEALGLHPSTTSRLLTTFKEMGVVEKDPLTQEYRLTYRILNLFEAVLSQMDLVGVALPIMRQLTEEMRESSWLVVPDGTRAVTVAQVTARRYLASPNYLGWALQMHATTSGKLFLAYGPQSRIETLLQEGLTQYTEHTLTLPEELLSQLDTIRQQGYAVANQESEIGLFGVGAPIRDHSSEVVAGLALSGPLERVGGEHFPEFRDAVIDAARRVSIALGWPKYESDGPA